MSWACHPIPNVKQNSRNVRKHIIQTILSTARTQLSNFIELDKNNKSAEDKMEIPSPHQVKQNTYPDLQQQFRY